MECDVGGTVKNDISDYTELAHLAEATKDDLQHQISFIRLESCFDPRTKLLVRGPEWPSGRKIIMIALAAEGMAHYHRGVAFAGRLEEHVAHLLETIEQ